MSRNLKKTKYLALIKAKDKAKGFTSLQVITSCFGLKRDAYYKFKDRADKRLKLEQQIIQIVQKRRKSLPREGVRKLKKSLNDDFTKADLKVGRDTLFKVLREHKMLTLRKKHSARTTNSHHRFYKYSNIIKDIKGLIHHSDRGIQYCSNVYTQILKRNKIDISMTEENHCYKNAMAERVNGILKR